MDPLDRVTIRGLKPLRSLALLALCGVAALGAALSVYIAASGETLVTFKDYGYAYFLVPTTAFVLMCVVLVAHPPEGEEIRTIPHFIAAFALAASVLSGYMAGLLYFSVPITREVAYITKDGAIHRGEALMYAHRMRPDDGYIVMGYGTPRLVPVARGRVSLLGFRFSYVISDEMLLRTDVDFGALAEKAAREIFGPVAAEKSRSKRVAALAEIEKPRGRQRDQLAKLFCERLDGPCPFLAIDIDWARTRDVPDDHWSSRYSIREALDEEQVKIAIDLLGPRTAPADRDALLALTLSKGTAEDVVSVLRAVPDTHPLYDALVRRALTEKLEHASLIDLVTRKLLRNSEHRQQARTRMLDEVPPSMLIEDRERKILMSVEEANAYGEKLLGSAFHDDDRARVLGAYHAQLMNPLAHKLADAIRGASAEWLMLLVREKFLDETLHDKAVDAIARAKDSAIAKVLLNRRSHYGDPQRLLTKPEMKRIIDGFLKNASDPKWFAAITNHADTRDITRAQAQELAQLGIRHKITEVFRIAFEPDWSTAEEASEILRAFLGYADKYDCIRALRTEVAVARGREGNALAPDIRAALEACAGDQMMHLKRRL